MAAASKKKGRFPTQIKLQGFFIVKYTHMSRGFIYAEPSQKEGVNFPKEVLLGVLQDSVIIKAALEAVHAAAQTESNNQKASALAAVFSALKKNPNLEPDDLTPIAVEVFQCPKSKEQRMLQILEDLHKPERFGAILSQLRQLLEVRPQKERLISLPASYYRDETAWNSTAATTAAADCTGRPDGGRLTLPATFAPNHETLINWMCSNLTGIRPSEELKRVDCAEASFACRDAWLCAVLEKRFDQIRDGNAGWNEFEQIGFKFADKAKKLILQNLEKGSSKAFRAGRGFSNSFCNRDPEVWKSAARGWAGIGASALANNLVCGVDKIRGQLELLKDKFGHVTLRIQWKDLPHDSKHVGLTAVLRKCFNDHVNERIGLFRPDLTSQNVEGFNGLKRYEFFKDSVHYFCGIALPNFYECRRALRDTVETHRDLPSPPDEFECNVDRDRLMKVAESYVKEFFGLEVAKCASRQLDKGPAISIPSYCDNPSAAAANYTDPPASSYSDMSASKFTAATTDPPDDGHSTLPATPAPKYERLIKWICSNLTGTRPPQELKRVDCAEASLFCREAWLCAELEKRFDKIRDGKAEWNEFEQIGLKFSDRAKGVIWRYLNGGSLYAFRGVRNVKNEFCNPNPELLESAARDWAVEEASALANKLVCGVGKVCGQVVPLSDKSGHATLRIILKVLPHESEHVGLTAVIRKCFTDHVNKRLGPCWLDLSRGKVKDLDGRRVRYDFFRKSVYEFCGILLPDSVKCRRAFRAKLVIDRDYPSTPGEFDCNVDKSRLIEVVQSYVKEVFGLEVAKPASKQLDKGTAISIPSYCNNPAAAASYTDPPATCNRVMSTWKPTAATTAAANCTSPPGGKRSTLPSHPECDRLTEVAESYVRKDSGLEAAKPASRQLDRGTAISNPFYSNNPSAAAGEFPGVPDDEFLTTAADPPKAVEANLILQKGTSSQRPSFYNNHSKWSRTVATTAAADATGPPKDKHSVIPAPKHESLIKWICINLTGTRTPRELRSFFHTDQADSFCRDAWLCAELEERFDRIRDGKAEWNEFEDFGFNFTDQAKNVILKYLKEGSPNAFQGGKNVDNEFCGFNPELWISAAREWAVERARVLANKLYSRVDKVYGQVLPSHTTGYPTLVVKWNDLDQIGSKHGLAVLTRRCVNVIVQQMIHSKCDLYRRQLTGGKRNELTHENCDFKAFQKFLRETIGIVLPDSDECDRAFRDKLGLDRVSPSPPHEFEFNVDTDRLIELAEDCIQRFFGLRGAIPAPRESDKSTAVSNPSCCNNPSAAAAESPGVPDDGRWTLLQPTSGPNHVTLINWICANVTETRTLEELSRPSGFKNNHCREAWLYSELVERFDRVRDGKAEWNEFKDIGFDFTEQAKNVILKYLKEGSSKPFQRGKNVDKFCDYNPELWRLAAHKWAVKEARVLASKLVDEVGEVSMFLTETDDPRLRVEWTYLPSNELKQSSLTRCLRKCFISYVNGRIDNRYRRYRRHLACGYVEGAKLFENFRNSVQVFSGIVISQSGVCCRAFRKNLGVSLASSSPLDDFKCQVDKDRLIKLAEAFLKQYFGLEGAEPAS